MSLEYKVLGQELVSYTDTTETTDTTSYYVSYEETGGPLFVSVFAFSNRASYSTDGVAWTETTIPNLAGSRAITYNDGKFVALDFYNPQGAYSTNGITWTIFSLPNVQNWYSVTYGGGKFVAVSSNIASTAAYSTDGVTWTETSLPTFTNNWRSITYGDGKFVAVSYNSGSAYSTDGITWTQTSISFAQWTSVTYGDGKFVAIGFSEIYPVRYSTDGITWTAPMSQVFGGNAVTFGQTTQLVETLNIIGGQGTTQSEEFLPVVFYTVPEGKQTTVTSIFVANHDDSESFYDLAVVPAGEELSLKHHLRWDMAVGPKDFENISTKITLSAGDSLVIFPSTVDTVSVTAFGVEK
jgi:hypothetical protein